MENDITREELVAIIKDIFKEFRESMKDDLAQVRTKERLVETVDSTIPRAVQERFIPEEEEDDEDKGEQMVYKEEVEVVECAVELEGKFDGEYLMVKLPKAISSEVDNKSEVDVDRNITQPRNLGRFRSEDEVDGKGYSRILEVDPTEFGFDFWVDLCKERKKRGARDVFDEMPEYDFSQFGKEETVWKDADKVLDELSECKKVTYNGVAIPASGWKGVRSNKKESVWLDFYDGSILCSHKNLDCVGENVTEVNDADMQLESGISHVCEQIKLKGGNSQAVQEGDYEKSYHDKVGVEGTCVFVETGTTDGKLDNTELASEHNVAGFERTGVGDASSINLDPEVKRIDDIVDSMVVLGKAKHGESHSATVDVVIPEKRVNEGDEASRFDHVEPLGEEELLDGSKKGAASVELKVLRVTKAVDKIPQGSFAFHNISIDKELLSELRDQEKLGDRHGNVVGSEIEEVVTQATVFESLRIVDDSLCGAKVVVNEEYFRTSEIFSTNLKFDEVGLLVNNLKALKDVPLELEELRQEVISKEVDAEKMYMYSLSRKWKEQVDRVRANQLQLQRYNPIAVTFGTAGDELAENKTTWRTGSVDQCDADNYSIAYVTILECGKIHDSKEESTTNLVKKGVTYLDWSIVFYASHVELIWWMLGKSFELYDKLKNEGLILVVNAFCTFVMGQPLLTAGLVFSMADTQLEQQ